MRRREGVSSRSRISTARLRPACPPCPSKTAKARLLPRPIRAAAASHLYSKNRIVPDLAPMGRTLAGIRRPISERLALDPARRLDAVAAPEHLHAPDADIRSAFSGDQSRSRAMGSAGHSLVCARLYRWPCLRL